MNTKLPPVHPGEVLLEDFMKPLNLTSYRVAKDIGMTPIAVTHIIHGKRSISAQTALILAKYFGTSAEVWIRLQAQYDLEVTREKIAARLAKVPLRGVADPSHGGRPKWGCHRLLSPDRRVNIRASSQPNSLPRTQSQAAPSGANLGNPQT